jgi:hypothetical protein
MHPRTATESLFPRHTGRSPHPVRVAHAPAETTLPTPRTVYVT